MSKLHTQRPPHVLCAWETSLRICQPSAPRHGDCTMTLAAQTTVILVSPKPPRSRSSTRLLSVLQYLPPQSSALQAASGAPCASRRTSISLPTATPRTWSLPSSPRSSSPHRHISSSAWASHVTSVPTRTPTPFAWTQATRPAQASLRLSSGPQLGCQALGRRSERTGSPRRFGQAAGSSRGQLDMERSSTPRPLLAMLDTLRSL
mmetsp:Transcript_147088/g.455026  ORF Transcript_147088/g.455026 Transcript_147088/m.455026 type:complete len:205 (+) Transcript_147088:22-636(+)